MSTPCPHLATLLQNPGLRDAGLLQDQFITVVHRNNGSSSTYGITNYFTAASQLAQTTLRSEIGKMDLDRTFEERDSINSNIVDDLDKACEPWGVKVMRYEFSNINPPQSVKDALAN